MQQIGVLEDCASGSAVGSDLVEERGSRRGGEVECSEDSLLLKLDSATQERCYLHDVGMVCLVQSAADRFGRLLVGADLLERGGEGLTRVCILVRDDLLRVDGPWLLAGSVVQM